MVFLSTNDPNPSLKFLVMLFICSAERITLIHALSTDKLRQNNVAITTCHHLSHSCNNDYDTKLTQQISQLSQFVLVVLHRIWKIHDVIEVNRVIFSQTKLDRELKRTICMRKKMREWGIATYAGHRFIQREVNITNR